MRSLLEADLRLSSESLRVTFHRLRKRFAEVLRETVANPSERFVEEEMDALRAAFFDPGPSHTADGSGGGAMNGARLLDGGKLVNPGRDPR